MNPTINLSRAVRLQCALISALLLLFCAGLSASPTHKSPARAKVTHRHHRLAQCDATGGHIFLNIGGAYHDVYSTWNQTSVKGDGNGGLVAFGTASYSGTVYNLACYGPDFSNAVYNTNTNTIIGYDN